MGNIKSMETFNNGTLYSNYGTKDEMVIGEVKEATLSKEIKTLVTLTLGGDYLLVNGHMIHELCQGKYAVYSREQQKLTGESAKNIDFPVFRHCLHAMYYCLGFVNKRILDIEADFKLYLERHALNHD